jgi:branched-chain amino acid transport system permease protein
MIVGLSRRKLVGVAAGIALLFALPDVARFTPLSFGTLHKGVLFGMAALGLNVLLRHTELVSFGHAAFFGGGAYGAAVLASHFDVGSGLLLLLGAITVATVLAVLIGWLVAGHLDIYFALLTLAFNQVLYAVVLGSAYFNYSDGLRVRRGGTDPPRLFGVAFEIDAYRVMLYYLTVVLLLVLLVVTWQLVRSPFGQALDAIGQDRTRARFIGIPVERYVWIAFTISGVYGGVAGGLFALMELHVRPEPTLFAFVSGEILFMAILGGFTTLVGPVVGGVVLVYLLDAARFYTEYFNGLTAVVLIFVVYFLPAGILGSLPDISAAAGRRREDPSLVADDLRGLAGRLRSGLDRATDTAYVLLFGVK